MPKRGAIDHTTLDSTSILRFIEDNWRLAPLAQRDANANSIASAFDFSTVARQPAFVERTPPGRRWRRCTQVWVYWAYGAAGLAAIAALAAALVTDRRRARRKLALSP